MSNGESELSDKHITAFIIFVCTALCIGGAALFWVMQKSRDAAFDSTIEAVSSDKDGALPNHKTN